MAIRAYRSGTRAGSREDSCARSRASGSPRSASPGTSAWDSRGTDRRRCTPSVRRASRLGRRLEKNSRPSRALASVSVVAVMSGASIGAEQVGDGACCAQVVGAAAGVGTDGRRGSAACHGSHPIQVTAGPPWLLRWCHARESQSVPSRRRRPASARRINPG